MFSFSFLPTSLFAPLIIAILTLDIEIEWLRNRRPFRVGGDAVIVPRRIPSQALQHEALIVHVNPHLSVLVQVYALECKERS